MNNVDTFVTERGTKYIFDGTTGFISPISEKLFECVNNTVKLDRNLILENADDNLAATMKKWPIFSLPTTIDLDIPFIKKMLKNIHIRN